MGGGIILQEKKIGQNEMEIYESKNKPAGMHMV